MKSVLLHILLLFGIFPAALAADKKKGDATATPPKWRQWELGSSAPVPADKALSTFRIAPGFSLELFPAEPMVVDPVCMAWDGNGRAWVVEMRGYMPDVAGTGETSLKVASTCACKIQPFQIKIAAAYPAVVSRFMEICVTGIGTLMALRTMRTINTQ